MDFPMRSEIDRLPSSRNKKEAKRYRDQPFSSISPSYLFSLFILKRSVIKPFIADSTITASPFTSAIRPSSAACLSQGTPILRARILWRSTKNETREETFFVPRGNYYSRRHGEMNTLVHITDWSWSIDFRTITRDRVRVNSRGHHTPTSHRYSGIKKKKKKKKG